MRLKKLLTSHVIRWSIHKAGGALCWLQAGKREIMESGPSGVDGLFGSRAKIPTHTHTHSHAHTQTCAHTHTHTHASYLIKQSYDTMNV